MENFYKNCNYDISYYIDKYNKEPDLMWISKEDYIKLKYDLNKIKKNNDGKEILETLGIEVGIHPAIKEGYAIFR